MERGARRGLTFLEIMVVIVILGVLLAVALPSMSGPRDRAALRSAARDFVTAGRLARHMAIVRGHETRLIIEFPEDEEERLTWRIDLLEPPEDDDLSRSEERERNRERLSEEEPRELHPQVRIASLRTREGELDLDEERHELRFFPNGNSTGLAIHLVNSRETEMTVDFEEMAGRVEVYGGKPKSFAAKLRERGLDPAQFGLPDDSDFASAEEGDSGRFYQAAGMSREERVDYYRDAAERIAERARARTRAQIEGPGAYYSEAARWGSN